MALLVDIGSTFTKCVLVDLEGEEVIGWSNAPTTVKTDVTIGLREALSKLEIALGIKVSDAKYKFACSSAKGGLRLAVIGLVPDLTVEAGKRAALGAGAKVIGTYSYGLTKRDIEKLVQDPPDIILLTGGIDGGDKEVIIHNAKMLAKSTLDVPIVVAGNRVAADEVEYILTSAGKSYVKVVENVLPELNKLVVEPAREAIREIFCERIVKAKGMEKVRELVDDVIMPTHAATLEAAKLLADGYGEEKGFGELLVVEVGGATVNVHSIAEWRPAYPDVIMKGIPEPRVKRTVEGDLGIRYNAPSILELVGFDKLQELTGLSKAVLDNEIHKLPLNVSRLPVTEDEFLIDEALARLAVEMAVNRHVGTITTMYTPDGEVNLQYGKDLRDVKCVIGTGGPIVFSRRPRWVLEGALYDEKKPHLLKPQKPKLFIDKKYIMFAMGLLSKVSPQKALRILKKYLCEV